MNTRYALIVSKALKTERVSPILSSDIRSGSGLCCSWTMLGSRQLVMEKGDQSDVSQCPLSILTASGLRSLILLSQHEADHQGQVRGRHAVGGQVRHQEDQCLQPWAKQVSGRLAC